MATKLVAMLALLAAMVGVNIAYLMLGWGLRPESWWWVIGLGFVGQALLRLLADRVFKEIKS